MDQASGVQAPVHVYSKRVKVYADTQTEMVNRRQMDALAEENLCFNPTWRDPLSSAKPCIRHLDS